MTVYELIERAMEAMPTCRRDDPLYEDLFSECCLAILEGKNPTAAALAYRDAEVAWRTRTCDLSRALLPDAVAVMTMRSGTPRHSDPLDELRVSRRRI